MARAACVYLYTACGVLCACAAAAGSPPAAGAGVAPSREPAGTAATTVSHTTDDKSAKWMESLRRELMRDNYDYQSHGQPRRAAASAAASAADSAAASAAPAGDDSDEPADDELYKSYDDRDRPVSVKPTRTMPDVPEYPQPAAKRVHEHSTSYRTVNEVQEYDDAMPAQEQKQAKQEKQSHGYSAVALERPVNEPHEDYADAMPTQREKQAKQSHSYSATERPRNEAQEEYADAMPEKGSKRSHGHSAPDRPGDEAHEENADVLPLKRQKQAKRSHGYSGLEKPEKEAQEEYADANPTKGPKPAKRSHGQSAPERPRNEAREEYADDMPKQGSKEARWPHGYSAPERPRNEAREEYADVVPMKGPKQAKGSSGYLAPDRPANEAPENYPGRGRTLKRTQAQGYPTGRPVYQLQGYYPEPAPASPAPERDDDISREDLYGPVRQVLRENGSLTDEEFEERRRSFLESLYELEDQLNPVYVNAAPGPAGLESRRGVPVGGRGGRGGRGGGSYQFAELPRRPARGGRHRDADPPIRPPRGRRGGPNRPRVDKYRHHKPNNAKAQSVASFVDPRDGIRRYKVPTDGGQFSNVFGGKPLFPPVWDEDGVYDGRAPIRGSRPQSKEDKALQKGNRSPYTDDIPPIRGGTPPKRDLRGRGDLPRRAVTEPKTPKLPPKPSHLVLPIADYNKEPIYQDVDDSGYANKRPYSEVWRDDGSSGEWRSGRSYLKRRPNMQSGRSVERRSNAQPPREPGDVIAAGYPERYASRRNAALLEQLPFTFTEPTCACHRNTTHPTRHQTR